MKYREANIIEIVPNLLIISEIFRFYTIILLLLYNYFYTINKLLYNYFTFIKNNKKIIVPLKINLVSREIM